MYQTSQCSTGGMKEGCGCLGTPQEQEKALDFGGEVERAKRERHAVLQQVRRRRALIFKRLTAKYGR
jgi:hypothetical protein